MKNLSRRDFLNILAVGAAIPILSGSAFSASDEDRKDDKKPNFVIFLTDDLGYGDLGCYGHPIMKTPNLDRFAQQGMRFTSCYSASSVCSPSRSAILTGRTPYRNGVFTWIPAGSDIYLRQDEITMAKLLKDINYATCHVGKWHLNGKFNSLEQPQPDDHGYDWWLATQNNAHPSHKNPDNFVRNGERVGKMEGFSSILIIEEAINWLKKHRDKNKPFFLTVWTHEPHLPIESDPMFMALYKTDDEGLKQHHGNVTQLDYAFGMLMKTLDKMNLTDDTFVVFTSDNGPEGSGTKGRTRGSTGGLRGRKRALYEGGIRVPGIVRWPGQVKPGSISDDPVIGSDIFSTICDIVDIPLPSDRTIDGASILPAFSGKSIQRKIPMYWRYGGAPGNLKIAMRQGDWKLLASEQLDQFELYNLKDDVQESQNLVDQESRRLEAMRQTLQELNAQIEAEGPDWWKNYWQRRARKRRSIKKGVDKTSTFDLTMGCTVTRSELGYKLNGAWEGFTLKKLEKPITKQAEFQFQYKTLTKATTKNGFLVFGTDAKNENLVKCGTLIGMGTHAIFVGSFNNHNQGTMLRLPFDKQKLFDATVKVNLETRRVSMQIDGKKLKWRLPVNVKAIRYYGYYVKNTQTAFSPITLKEKH